MLTQILDFVVAHPLTELGIVTCILVIMGYLAKLFKQPVLVGYILAGVLLSPQVFDFISHQGNIELYAHFGVSLLLFMVGLGLNPRIIHEVGKVSVVAGVGQVVFTALIGFAIAYGLGFDSLSSLYIAIALTFSSTIVIVKLISDRGDTSTVYGKVSLGILIVQDIIAMLILIVISATMMDTSGQTSLEFFARLAGSLAALGGFVRGMTVYVLPPILRSLSRTRELLLLFVITRALLLGSIWYFFGFSMEIGALLAGISLASSQFRFHVFSELRPLRDFFLALFFVYLGSQVIFDNIGLYLIPVIIFSLFVLIGNPFIVMLLMKQMGYTRKTGFMTGLTVAQISEFSFIVVSLAITAGHITDPVVLSVVTVVGLLTMTGSSYLFLYADKLYTLLTPYLSRFESKKAHNETVIHTTADVIIVGYHRIGKYLATKFHEQGKSLLIIDHDPKQLQEAQQNGLETLYGDANSPDLRDDILSTTTQYVCSTVSDYDTNRNVLRIIKEFSPSITVVTLAQFVDEAEDLYKNGGDYVMIPHVSGALNAWSTLEQTLRNRETIPQQTSQHRDALRQHRQYMA